MIICYFTKIEKQLIEVNEDYLKTSFFYVNIYNYNIRIEITDNEQMFHFNTEIQENSVQDISIYWWIL